MKGLSFSEPMMKAWLKGTKSIARRLMSPQPDSDHQWKGLPGYLLEHKEMACDDGLFEKFWHRIAGNPFSDSPLWIRYPYTPGETVYIKETWAVHLCCGQNDENIHYRADEQSCPIDGRSLKWKSPRFMPAWASRSHARIVSVIPERLQEINEIDAFLEGFRDQLRGDTFWSVGAQFKEIWEALHPGTWDQNPFVWRIELEKEKP